MRYFYSALGFLVFLLALSFGLKNAQPITLHYYLGIAWDAPLILVLVAVFFAGVAAGLLAFLSIYVRQRKQMLAMQKELKAIESDQE
jgi:lipopolysaccharide assembly protein A